MRTTWPTETQLTPESFSRRLKADATSSGPWAHVRSRPGSLMSAAEPLLELVPSWQTPTGNRAVYGLRRAG